MEESTAKAPWQTIWTDFVSAWKVLCKYHEAASKNIGKAFDDGRLVWDEAVLELGYIREEMKTCRGCK